MNGFIERNVEQGFVRAAPTTDRRLRKISEISSNLLKDEKGSVRHGGLFIAAGGTLIAAGTVFVLSSLGSSGNETEGLITIGSTAPRSTESFATTATPGLETLGPTLKPTPAEGEPLYTFKEEDLPLGQGWESIWRSLNGRTDLGAGVLAKTSLITVATTTIQGDPNNPSVHAIEFMAHNGENSGNQGLDAPATITRYMAEFCETVGAENVPDGVLVASQEENEPINVPAPVEC